jgi:hypothetical protein
MTAGEKPNPAFEDLAAHALGVLEDEENDRVLALLSESPAARAELRELLEGAEVLGRSLPAIQTPPGMKERLLAAAEPERSLAADATLPEAQPARGLSPADVLTWMSGIFKPARLAMATSAAALIVAAILAGTFGRQTSDLRDEIHVLESELVQEKDSRAEMVSNDEVSRLRETNNALQEALRDQMWLTYVSNNQSWDASEWLTGGSTAPRAHATIVVKRGTQEAVLLVGGLDQLRPGENYQLWFTADGDMSPMASFEVDQAGTARVPFTFNRNIYDYDGAAVTVETGKNVPSPSAHHVLFTESSR